ncbi:hypothetical protein EVAR_93475_1 [Eumeta japonica]|uniref:Uncharacterized protein n=1 Tax=Eumeta variegata TaxID=151549 RepID=A0A4C1TML7_EUMVA|nr:hypothetical protein EVAR_93475_1 [Eumeta japonica]
MRCSSNDVPSPMTIILMTGEGVDMMGVYFANTAWRLKTANKKGEIDVRNHGARTHIYWRARGLQTLVAARVAGAPFPVDYYPKTSLLSTSAQRINTGCPQSKVVRDASNIITAPGQGLVTLVVVKLVETPSASTPSASTRHET